MSMKNTCAHCGVAFESDDFSICCPTCCMYLSEYFPVMKEKKIEVVNFLI